MRRMNMKRYLRRLFVLLCAVIIAACSAVTAFGAGTVTYDGENAKTCKVDAIVREIGKQPVLAFGNSATDASMLNYTVYHNKYKALGFMLRCDDLTREYGNLQKAEKMQQACEKYGWVCVSMKDDWKTIYGPQIKRR